MRAVDLIVKKREGGTFSEEEIGYLVRGFVEGEIPDYQFAALLMAVFWRGMSFEETAFLTGAMIDSGDVIDLSGVSGPLVDKHSTGGVGDKVSLVLAPLAAACGLKVPMMSGRSLGHTGGTLDKLESIRGYRTDLDRARFLRGLSEVGYAMIGQSESVVPADRKMYALRDVTGTVESIPLITASIMSKKFAEGAHALLFDVKTGSGAFMKTLEASRALANSLVRTGKSLGRVVAAVISDMDQPLGRKIGNFLEVEESVDCLNGKGPKDLTDLTIRQAGWMLRLGGVCGSAREGETLARKKLADGSALRTFLSNVEFQGGDVDCVLHPEKGPHARIVKPVVSASGGYVDRVDAYGVGVASVVLGAGRSRKEDAVLPGVGITLEKTQGDEVREGEELALVHGEDQGKVEEAIGLCRAAFAVTREPRVPPGRSPDLIVEEIDGA
jgi:pyrimidine-nucleoside phosphorylase